MEIEMGSKAVEKYADKLQLLPLELAEAFHDAIDEMQKKIELYLMEQLARYELTGTKLSGKIKVRRTETGISININNEYWTFVEYGTGIVGAGAQHPNPEAGWQYDTEGHGNKGWWYPTTDDDPNPLKRRGKDDGVLYAWTKGQRARPFMYNTWMYGRQAFTPVVMKHQRRALKRRMK